MLNDTSADQGQYCEVCKYSERTSERVWWQKIISKQKYSKKEKNSEIYTERYTV